MKTINRETYIKILHNNCDKNKHRFRSNRMGISFCVICGLLSNKPAPMGDDNEVLKITME